MAISLQRLIMINCDTDNSSITKQELCFIAINYLSVHQKDFPGGIYIKGLVEASKSRARQAYR